MPGPARGAFGLKAKLCWRAWKHRVPEWELGKQRGAFLDLPACGATRPRFKTMGAPQAWNGGHRKTRREKAVTDAQSRGQLRFRMTDRGDEGGDDVAESPTVLEVVTGSPGRDDTRQ